MIADETILAILTPSLLRRVEIVLVWLLGLSLPVWLWRTISTAPVLYSFDQDTAWYWYLAFVTLVSIACTWMWIAQRRTVAFLTTDRLVVLRRGWRSATGWAMSRAAVTSVAVSYSTRLARLLHLGTAQLVSGDQALTLRGIHNPGALGTAVRSIIPQPAKTLPVSQSLPAWPVVIADETWSVPASEQEPTVSDDQPIELIEGQAVYL